MTWKSQDKTLCYQDQDSEIQDQTNNV